MISLKVHLNNLPEVLVDSLQEEFQKLHRQYFLGRWEPSQLDAGRFAEVVFRILQYKQNSSFTQIGTQIDRTAIYNSVKDDTSLPESLRFHVLKLSDTILDFRNKRNVAHLGSINVNEMDSTFVLQSANWIVAELIRSETQMDPADAQDEIKKIIERKVPIIEEIGGRLKCLNPKLSLTQKVLVFCYQKYPERISLNDLHSWTGYSNKSMLRDRLVSISSSGEIDYNDGTALLTRKGVLWVEENISFDLDL